ncbi:MAG: hypothetical protein ACYCQJ_15030 [Nitrososphaerales archaeon]
MTHGTLDELRNLFTQRRALERHELVDHLVGPIHLSSMEKNHVDIPHQVLNLLPLLIRRFPHQFLLEKIKLVVIGLKLTDGLHLLLLKDLYKFRTSQRGTSEDVLHTACEYSHGTFTST